MQSVSTISVNKPAEPCHLHSGTFRTPYPVGAETPTARPHRISGPQRYRIRWGGPPQSDALHVPTNNAPYEETDPIDSGHNSKPNRRVHLAVIPA